MWSLSLAADPSASKECEMRRSCDLTSTIRLLGGGWITKATISVCVSLSLLYSSYRSHQCTQPLRALTTQITATYNLCNPQFRYESAHNPRRVLTKPSKPAHNDGYDNEDYDYILYVNDWLGSVEGQKYVTIRSQLLSNFFPTRIDQMSNQVPNFGRVGAGNVRAGCQVPEFQDERDIGCQSDKKQASLLQPEYDGGYYIADGQYFCVTQRIS